MSSFQQTRNNFAATARNVENQRLIVQSPAYKRVGSEYDQTFSGAVTSGPPDCLGRRAAPVRLRRAIGTGHLHHDQ